VALQLEAEVHTESEVPLTGKQHPDAQSVPQPQVQAQIGPLPSSTQSAFDVHRVESQSASAPQLPPGATEPGRVLHVPPAPHVWPVGQEPHVPPQPSEPQARPVQLGTQPVSVPPSAAASTHAPPRQTSAPLQSTSVVHPPDPLTSPVEHAMARADVERTDANQFFIVPS
jgi:hypothetical protein